MKFKFVGGECFRREGMRACRRTHFRSDTAQRYIRAQRTRSKCRRCFTVLHHALIPSRLRFLPHNFKFKQEEKKTELYRLTRRCSLYLYCCSEMDIYSCFQKDSWKKVDCSQESTVFTFCVEFEIIGDSACWMRAENSGIQTDGCAFPGKVEWESGDFGMAVVKLKTGNPALRFTMELSARNASFHCESCF